MKHKLVDRVRREWEARNDEGFQTACFKMDWKCQQDYDYTEKFKKWVPTLYAIHTTKDLYVIEQGTWSEDLDILADLMDDDILLDFWEEQLCLKYR